MNQTAIERLAALGYPADSLPNMAKCQSCQGKNNLHISYEIFENSFVIWCGCGDSVEHADLVSGINQWNELQGLQVRPGKNGGH